MSGHHLSSEKTAAAPFDDSDERAVLGCLLNHPRETIDLIGGELDPSLFFSPVCKTMFAAMTSLLEGGAPLGLLTLTSHLKQEGNLEAVGGPGPVTALTNECNAAPLSSLSYHLGRIREQAAARLAVQASQRLLEMAKNASASAAEIAMEMERQATAIRAVGQAGDEGRSSEPRIRFFAPSELRDYKPETDVVLVGNCHVMRGEVFIIGGEPGVGKSRAATALAVSGATQRDWFGLSVHRQFKTMIVQTENGRYRLQQEFSALDSVDLEGWIRVSEPPPFGLTLSNAAFQDDIGEAMASFKPDCVIIDPWNATTRDDKQSDYCKAFDDIRSVLQTGIDKPALGIVAHTRKPQPNEKRTGGTGLMHLLAGSYLLTSVPRSIFIMVRGTEDETDDSVVWLNPKNSNGEHAPRSAWRRVAKGFDPITNFDWSEFEKPAAERKTVTLSNLAEVFDNGRLRLELGVAKRKLATLVGIEEGSAYNALSQSGKFADHLSRDGKNISFKP